MRMTRKIRRAWLRGKPEWAKCYLLKQRLRKETKVINFEKKQPRLHKASRYLVAGVMLACLGIGNVTEAAITAVNGAPAGSVVTNGAITDVYNQQVKNGSALNKFTDFDVANGHVANLQLDAHGNFKAADRQINLVTNKINIDGVVNAFKDGKIGGDIYFFSSNGMAVGSTGVINVGRLTVGTSAHAAEDIYDDWSSYNAKTAAQKNEFLIIDRETFEVDGKTYYKEKINDGNIKVDGVVNSIGNIILSAKEVTVGADASLNAGASFKNDGKVSSGATAEDYRSKIINLTGINKADTAVATSSGDIVLFGKDNVGFSGDAVTNGGNFDVSSEATISFTGTTANAETNTPENKVVVVTDGGDIAVNAVRGSTGTTSVEVVNAVLDASDKAIDGTANGNVKIKAETNTETYSWAIGMESVAEIDIENSAITGDNVNVFASASNTGVVGQEPEKVTEEAVAKAMEAAKAQGENSNIGAMLTAVADQIATDKLGEIRTIATYTDVGARAEVHIKESEIDAIGGTKANDSGHGYANVKTDARSDIQTTGLGLFNFNFTFGVSSLDSKIIIEDSNLFATKDVSLDATGINNVGLSYLEVGKVLPIGAGATYAELNSDVSVNVDEDSLVEAKEDFLVSANSTRSLSAAVVSGSDKNKLGAGVAIGVSNTKADAIVKSDVYAGGDVSVNALNTIGKDANGHYTPDSVSAESMSGNNFVGKALIDGIGVLVKKIKNRHTAQVQNIEQDLPGLGSDWGLNVSTAVLLSDNYANAYFSGKVRGFDTSGIVSDTVGVKSITVKAENVSRTSLEAFAYQNQLTDTNGIVLNSKNTGISLPVLVGIQNNTATAIAGGDLKVDAISADDKDAITVEAVTRIPWEWESVPSDLTLMNFITTTFGATTDQFFNIGSLCDSWAQGTATVEDVGAAGSVSVMDYTGVADAHVEKNAVIDIDNGDLKVNALNDITTVNFSGNISSPITMLPWATWESTKNRFKNDVWGTEAEGAAIGGAAVAAHHKFTAKAYIEDSDMLNFELTGSVSADNVNVDAKNDTLNLTLAASGGKSGSVGIDGTVNVTLTDNVTEAYIGQANVSAETGSVKVKAIDNALVAALGGGVGVSSGAVGIGGTIAYNHISRDTSAYINGIVTATDAVEVNAKNTGEILAVTISGAETYDGNLSNVFSAGGSRGGHTHQNNENGGAIEIEMNNEAGENGFVDLAQDLLNIGTAGGHVVDNGNDTINNVANQGHGANDYVNKAKNGFAIAANVAVNDSVDNANAYIAKGSATGVVPTVNAGYVRVKSGNDSKIISASGEASVDLSTGRASTGIAGSFMYNSIDSGNNAYISDATINVTGNTSTDDKSEAIDEALTIAATNEEEILNIAIGGSIAPKGSAVVGQIGINSINNDTTASLLNSTVTAGEKISVNANDKAKIQSYIGSGSGTGKGFVGIGASIGVQDIDANTTAKIENASIAGTSETAYGNLEVTAQEESAITSIVGTASGGLANMSAAFSVSANDVDTVTNAYIDSDENIKAAAISVAAKNLANSTIGVGSVAVGKNSVGIATAIALSDNAVTAYLKGDDASDGKDNTVNGSSINVEAENVYNGAANYDDANNTTAKTVAIGGGVGTGAVAATGSVTVNIIDNDTQSYLGAGIYDSDGAVNVKADSHAHMFGLAGGLAVGVKATGVGAAVDTQLLDVDTKAYIDDRVTITKAGNITVDADSLEKITSVATLAGISHYFAGAAAANAHDVNVNTEAYIGTDKAADSDETTISNTGSVSVTADDNATLKANAGSAAVTISGTGAGSGTLSAAVEVLDKNVKATVGKANITAQNLTAKANNVGSVLTTANGVAATVALYGGALSGSASESIVDYHTDAHIADGANITVTSDVIVDADSSFSHTGEAAAAAGSTLASAGLSNDTTVLNTETLAYIGNNAQVSAKDIDITANNSVSITSAVAAASIGAVGGNGSVGVNDIDSITKAYIGASANVTATGTATNEGITVAAEDTTSLSGGSGGTTVGLGNAGAAVNVNNINKDTQAYIGSNSAVNSKGILSVNAKNNEDIYNLTIQGTGGLAAGVAGAVGVYDLNITTKAYTDSGVNINQADGYANGGNITFTAENDLDIESTIVGAAFAGVGVGAAVDVANIITQTNAYIGNNNSVKNGNTLNITATESFGTASDKIKSAAVSGTIAGGSINGGISVYSYGSGMSSEDKKQLESSNAQTIDGWTQDYINQSSTKDALGKYEGNTVAAQVGQAVENRNFTSNITNTVTTGAEGTAAKIGSNSNIVSNGNVTVNASNSLHSETSVGSGVLGCLALGAAVGVVNNNSEISSSVDNGANISGANAFTVTSNSSSDIQGKSVAPAVGINAGAAASLDFNNNASVLTNIGNGVQVTANAINFNSHVTGNMYAHATGVGVGISGVGLVVSLVDSNEDATTNVGENINLNAENGTIAITANSDITGKVKAEAGAGGVIDGAVTVTQVDLDNDINVNLGSTGTITAKQFTLKAEHDDASSYENISAGAGLASGEGSDSRTTINSDVNVNVGSKDANPSDKLQITTSKLFDVDADNSSVIDWLEKDANGNVVSDAYNSLSAGAALVTGTGIVNRTNITHNTNVNLDDAVVKGNAELTQADRDAGKILAYINAVTIDAHSNIVSRDYQYIGTGAAIEVAHISDENKATANTKVNLGSNAELYAGDTVSANSKVVEDNITTTTHGYVDVGGGSISIGARNDADMFSSTVVSAWGVTGYTGSDNIVEYNGDVGINVDSDIETANGDVRVAAGYDSAGNNGETYLKAHSLLANSTGFPISVHPEPEANVDIGAKVTVGSASNIKSDGDIYLLANKGYVYADGYSEVNDWFNTIGDAFAPNQSIRGTEKIDALTDVEVQGAAETGIHRKQSITIGGSNDGSSNWHTDAERTTGIAFEYSGAQELQHQLSKQLEELRRLRAEYISDSSTVAAYDKEIKLIQDQMVTLGLAYYENGTTFVEYNVTGASYNTNMLYTSGETTTLMGKVNGLIADYTALANNSATSDGDRATYNGYVTKLNEFKEFVQEKIDATNAFLAVSGNTVTADGKFMVGANEVNSYVKDENGFTFILASDTITASPTANNKITLNDIVVELGNIYVEGDNLYGAGKLLAPADAEVRISNNTPNDLVINDIKIVGTRSTDQRINEGANIIFNDIFVNGKEDISKRNIDKSKNVAFSEVKNNKNTSSFISVQNTFNPSNYRVNSLPAGASAHDSEKIFTASDITIAQGAHIYNEHGSVNVNSDYGDVYSYGTIDADTVNVRVNNGSYVQKVEDDSRIVNVGGDPGAIHDNGQSVNSGIFANGDIVIDARYVNVNSTIQSGSDDWRLEIPENIAEKSSIPVYYYVNGVLTKSNLKDTLSNEPNVDNGMVYFVEDPHTEKTLGSAYKHLAFDLTNDRFVLDGLSIQGGSVDIRGTILNTSSGDSGKIIAMDGGGYISITNNCNKDLEVRNIDVGEGAVGVIKITDRDLVTGRDKTETTYTRTDNKVTAVRKNFIYDANGIRYTEDDLGETSTYTPADLYYVWQTGQDTSTVTEYHYSDSKAVIWWEDGNFSDDDLEDMDVVSKTTGDQYNLPAGTFVAGTSALQLYDANKNPVDVTGVTSGSQKYYDKYGNEVNVEVAEISGNYTKYKYTYTTSTSEPYDEKVETHRTWYTLGIQKIYDHWFKIKEGTTTITQNSLKANNPISIGFVGNDDRGILNIIGESSDVIFNGTISNVGGSTFVSADDIWQGANGYIKTRDLALKAINNVGALDNLIQTNAVNLSGNVTNGVLAVEVLHNDVYLGNTYAGVGGIKAGTTAYIKAAGNITQNSYSDITANRIELYSQTGSIGSSDELLQIRAGKGSGNSFGLKAEAAGDIYITNSNGDLYLDSVISKAGDVVLKTNGSFIDNNNTDAANAAVDEALNRWKNAQVLENTKEAADFQKEMLCYKADANYNRYHFLKKYANAKGVLAFNENDKQDLKNMGYNNLQIAKILANFQAEYDNLLAMGASEAWTAEALAAYKAGIKNDSSYGSGSIYANASLTKEDLSSTLYSNGTAEFLTVEQKAEVLVGSTKQQKNLVVNLPNDINTENVDTVFTTKTVPNVKGVNITLESAVEGGGVGSSHTVTTTEAKIQELLAKDFSNWDEWSENDKKLLEAWKSAERGDIVTDANGNMTITVVDAIEVEATGNIQAKTLANGNVFLNSAKTMNLGDVTVGGELRLKTKESINANTIEAAGRIVLEASGGTIGKGVKQVASDDTASEIGFMKIKGTVDNLIARAKDDIKFNKEGDLGVDLIFSEQGDVVIDLASADGTKNDLTAVSEGVNIKADSVTLTNIATAGTSEAKLGVAVDGGLFKATVADTAHIATYETMYGAQINAGTLDVANKGILTKANFTASGSDASTFTNTGHFLNSKVTTQGNLNVLNLEAGAISTPDGEWDLRSEFTSKKGGVSYSAGPNTETYAVILKAAKDVDVKLESAKITPDIYSIDAGGNVKITADKNLDAGTIDAQNVNAEVAGDFAVGTIDVAEDMNINVGNNMRVTNILRGEEVHVDVANTFSGQSIIADVIDVDANVINSLYTTVNETGNNPIMVGSSAGTISSKQGVINGLRGGVSLQADSSIDVDKIVTNGGSINLTSNEIDVSDLSNASGNDAEVSIKGIGGASARKATIGSRSGRPIWIVNSDIQNLVLNGLNNIGIKNSIIGSGKIFAALTELNIKKDPNSRYGLIIEGFDKPSDFLFMSFVKGIQVNGLRKLNKKYRTLNANMYANDYSSKEEQKNALDNIKSAGISFAEVDHEEEYEIF